MAHKNTELNAAKKNKQDEFYTQLSDIEKELRHYKQYFAGKTVFCNCDDPFESNFFKYFVLNFNRFALKKLIATCYTGSPIANQQLSLFDIIEKTEENENKPYKAVVTTVYDKTGDGSVDMLDVAELFKSGENELTELHGDGDFRSPECLELLDEADIIVTNPPFSIFREYLSIILAHKKAFLIVGNMNALKYKELFPLLRGNKMWLGYKTLNGGMDMIVPDKVFDPSKVKKFYVNEKREKIVNVMGVCWFTNLDIKKRHEEMILVKRYNPSEYPNYVNYDAIEVSKSSDIPCDYAGKMGVPITFMDKYCPDQFEILGYSLDLAWPISEKAPKGKTYTKGGNCFYLDEGKSQLRRLYDRLVIRNKNPEPPREG